MARLLALCIVFLSGVALGKVESVEEAIEVKFIPVLYVSPKPERADPDQVFLYSATVCDGKLYHQNNTVVRVNMPYGWNPDIGTLAKLEVCDSADCGKVYCSNYNNGKFTGNHYCNYTYNATMGDIVVRVTAGPGPNIDWTVAVEFVPVKDWVPPPPVAPKKMLEFFPEPQGSGGRPLAATVLMQIVKTSTEQTVTTLARKEFFFRFCPDSETGSRFDVAISTVAVDSKSAMSTYVCLPTELPCSPTSSNHYDPRGTSINSVTLTTGSGQLTELHVLVIGWGDGSQTNTFVLGATTTKKQ
ncbi:predicted protein [Nematostella vectensis]|uniref:Uncharacterized protein n=1 Tax=Nematostella vectensis TaxID=45351 RepID=A7SAP7_NEMVE|nr:predicted protein [Nematostella vectensis]|eukprot:XP_001631318.1 predicted protein [Nematostella vectensis]